MFKMQEIDWRFFFGPFCESAFCFVKCSREEYPGDFFSFSPAEHPHLDDIIFTKDDLEEAISELSADSAAGPDGVPAKLLKECKTILSHPLCLLWRKSMD